MLALSTRTRERGYSVASYCIACVMLVAAILKAYELVTVPILSDVEFLPRTIQVVLVELELSLAIWLLLGTARIWAWRVTLATFVTFAIASLWMLMIGKESCGCFGAATVNPLLALGADAFTIVCLIQFRPEQLKQEQTIVLPGGYRYIRWFAMRTRTALMAFAILSGVVFAFAALSQRAMSVSSEGFAFAAGNTIVLKPALWVGKKFPLLPYIEADSRLADGDWVVWLYHDSCPTCRQRLRSLTPAEGNRLVIIEVPPYSDSLERIPFARGRLTERYDWFIETPVAITIRDGVVKTIEGASRTHHPTGQS